MKDSGKMMSQKGKGSYLGKMDNYYLRVIFPKVNLMGMVFYIIIKI